ncbi:MAG: helix-turn-helix transcriptional regulator [Bacteroidales bacterium]
MLYLDPGLTINKLAKEIGTNRTYLSKFFSGEKGCKFRDYINMLRAEHAKSLLLTIKRYAIADIAILSGFGSVRALNRAFRKNFGKLPSQLRKELLRADSEPPLQ